MEEFLSSIGIHNEGTLSNDGSYVIDFDNVDDYNSAFTKLDKFEGLDESEESSIVNASISNVIYMNEDYLITLTANFDDDQYKLVIKEMGDN